MASTRAPVAAVCFGCSAVGRVGRRAVERTFAWLTAHHRLARDYEREPAVSEVMIRWAAINTIHPTTRPRRAGEPAATVNLHPRKLILSNTL